MDCEAAICPDLVGATVIEHRVRFPEKPCDSYVTVPAQGLDGCAALNLSTGVCTIYMERHPSRETVRHEWSHCMGWAHTWDPQKQRYEWFPMPEVLKYDFAAKEGADGHITAGSVSPPVRE